MFANEDSPTSGIMKIGRDRGRADDQTAAAIYTPAASYDSEISLAQREERWGFSLLELQAATKVVSRLFHNPSLFIADPYLADSRLYTMITRDRKTKRDNREVYKTIMNEEKHRRKRFERKHDLEMIQNTGMKRERTVVLNALLSTNDDRLSGARPLQLCSEKEWLSSGGATGSDGGAGDAEDARQQATESSQVKAGEQPCLDMLSTVERDILRLMGAFENLLRLQRVLQEGEAVACATIATATTAIMHCPHSVGVGQPRSSKPVDNAPEYQARDEEVLLYTGSKTAPKNFGNGVAPQGGFAASSIDWAVATQLIAQVYRYISHEFGSQLPPPLFAGPIPLQASPMERCYYITGYKLAIARRLKDLVELERGDGADAQLGPQGAIDMEGDLALLLQKTRGVDVVLCSPVKPLLFAEVDVLRQLVGRGHGEDKACCSREGDTLLCLCRVCADPALLLNALGHVLEERRSNVEPILFASAPCDSSFSVEQVAEQTLNLFIARRLYQCSRLFVFGPSPITWTLLPPTDSGEPKTPCIFEQVQQYSCEQKENQELFYNRGCYTCKGRFRNLHPYYYSMCHLCAEYNYNKRLLARDLRGKVVLLTGCRIKIGFAMALSLLRCGATVLGTTRFAYEAIARFQQEADYALWKDRLHLFSLDLRDLGLVVQFCGFVRLRFPRLFAIINNAAQTIARPPQYTAHIRLIEQNPSSDLRSAMEADTIAQEWNRFFSTHSTLAIGEPLSIEHRPRSMSYPPVHTGEENQCGQTPDGASGDDKRGCNGGMVSVVSSPTSTSAKHMLIFDRYDSQTEARDCRGTNSWVMKLAEVQGGEAAEVMAINALAPFIFNSKLKPCLLNREGDNEQNEARFIINVSAMEGQFYRFKTTSHPHTNMAKAALNMMTRTSATDYAQGGIYMNSVDTGWITDESPKDKRERRAKALLLCPLDEVDAAARCLDLIYTNSSVHGMFYKDYKEIPW